MRAGGAKVPVEEGAENQGSDGGDAAGGNGCAAKAYSEGIEGSEGVRAVVRDGGLRIN